MKNKKGFFGGLLVYGLGILFILSVVIWAIDNPGTAAKIGKEILSTFFDLVIRVGKFIAKTGIAMAKEISKPEYASNVSLVNITG